MASLIPRRAPRLLHSLSMRCRTLHTSPASIETADFTPPITNSHTTSSDLEPITTPLPPRSKDLPVPKVKAPKLIKKGYTSVYDPTRVPLHDPPTEPLKITEHLRETLPLLASQGPHYITIHIHGKPYLVTQGDTLRLPFLMHGVSPGDILRLNRASIIGSRDFTLRGGAIPGSTTVPSKELTGNAYGSGPELPDGTSPIVGRTDGQEVYRPYAVDPEVGRTAGLRKKGPSAYIDERLFEVRATVMGTETEPLRIKIKKKQRNRHERQVRSKEKFTILKISEIKIKDLEDVKNV